MRRWFLVATAVLGGACGIGRAQEDVSTTPKAAAERAEESGSLAERFKSLRKEVDDAEAAYLQMIEEYVRAVETNAVTEELKEERNQAWTAYTSTADTVMPQIVVLARKDPKAEAAFEALEWVVVNGRQAWVKQWGVQATEILRDNHAGNPKVGRLCAALGFPGWAQEQHEPARDFLRGVAEQNPDRTARGLATFSLAKGLEYWARRIRREDEGDPQPLLDEAETLFERVSADYADIEFPDFEQLNRPRTLGDLAKTELFAIRHLAIGSEAPEIEGEDTDGTRFRLSDYRGKVVVLNFWGDW